MVEINLVLCRHTSTEMSVFGVLTFCLDFSQVVHLASVLTQFLSFPAESLWRKQVVLYQKHRLACLNLGNNFF